MKELLNNDPFKYYWSYDFKEFLDANDKNNWLIRILQTQEKYIG
ncbi:hypothetical protein SPD48_07140 [Pseudogracilibacillus sp. SE30717A]